MVVDALRQDKPMSFLFSHQLLCCCEWYQPTTISQPRLANALSALVAFTAQATLTTLAARSSQIRGTLLAVTVVTFVALAVATPFTTKEVPSAHHPAPNRRASLYRAAHNRRPVPPHRRALQRRENAVRRDRSALRPCGQRTYPSRKHQVSKRAPTVHMERGVISARLTSGWSSGREPGRAQQGPGDDERRGDDDAARDVESRLVGMLGYVVLDVLGGLIPLDTSDSVARAGTGVVEELLRADEGAPHGVHGLCVGSSVSEELPRPSEGFLHGIHGLRDVQMFKAAVDAGKELWEDFGNDSGECCCSEIRARLTLQVAPHLVPHVSWQVSPSANTALP